MTTALVADEVLQAVELELGGTVQGVGFRPFVYRLAQSHGIRGWVRNEPGRVRIYAEGRRRDLRQFAHDVVATAPPRARPVLLRRGAAALSGASCFRVDTSAAVGPGAPGIPTDAFLCHECAEEFSRPGQRRYRYPFLNCTQCGPRFSLIDRLPYDRCNTSMHAFEPCSACAREYRDPGDRRFHAETNCCPVCGPRLSLRLANGRVVSTIEVVEATSALLRAGAIVAVKGIGGYHLMCDASSAASVSRLRARKRRPSRPLAVMFPASGCDGLDAVREVADVSDAAADALTGPARPIVLLPRATSAKGMLSDDVAPGLDVVGAMLPSSPLHALLLQAFRAPLVATSANVSGSPIIVDGACAERELSGIADAYLHHDRSIVRPLDDPVVFETAGSIRTIRTGRGNAPLEVALPVALDVPVLAVGGHMKNTICLAWERRAILSAHIGDLDGPGTLRRFEQTVSELSDLYGVVPERVTCDEHGAYASSRWAARHGAIVETVLHHHAHASALAVDAKISGDLLVFTWDGAGLGDDGTLWGGETFWGRPGQWQRVARLRPFRLPGGDRAARTPWLSGAALSWEADLDWPAALALDPVNLVRHAWERAINCHVTSAAGRLFDAAAALVGSHYRSSFEGEGPMRLESLALATPHSDAQTAALITRREGLWEIDWRPLVPMLLDESVAAPRRARVFHVALADAIAAVARTLRAQLAFDAVGLTGGVFQNRLLCGLTRAELGAQGFKTLEHRDVPCNDGGLSVGQVAEYLGRTAHRDRTRETP